MDIKSDKVEIVSTNLLIPYSKNSNKHTDEQIDEIIKQIEYQGWRDPILAQKGTNIIAAGHGRWMAAKKMGLEKVPVIFQEFESEAQFYAFVVAHNAVTSPGWGGGLDLAQINSDIIDFGPELDVDLLGIKDFVIEPIEKFEPQSDEDDVPEVVHPITRKGDIWLLGNHRLMCGDSTMIDDVEKLMNGEKADMVFTDPPYGMKLQTDNRGMGNSKSTIGGRELKEYRPVLGDSDYFNPSFLFEFFKPSEIFLWGADYYCWDLPKNGSWIVWDKTGGNDSLVDAGFGSNFELCWSIKPHKRDIARITYKGVAGMKKEDGKRVHPTQKPVGLCEWFFNKWGKDYSILDLFLGSGSTLIACEKTNRKCYGMELDEKYCDVIINRWQNYTGKKAVLESTNQTYEELKKERGE